mgnify:CR=1 FL=1
MADDLGLSKLTGGLSLSSIQSGVADFGQYILWGILILGVVVFAWMKYQDKKVYIYPVRIMKQRNNGQVKELNTFGGYVNKGHVTQFMVKMSKFKKKAMDKLPDSEWMDEDNRVYYWQVSPESSLIQVKRGFVIDKILVPNEKFVEPTEDEKKKFIDEVIVRLKADEQYKDFTEEKYNEIANQIYIDELNERRNNLIDITHPTYKPIPTDLKQQAIADISNYKNVLGVDVNKQFAYFVMGVIALVIVATVIFYIAVNKGDIPILTK